jgi:two-component system, NtrC family, response regulator AtoC
VSEDLGKGGPARKARVLIVDDDASQVHLLTQSLERAGRFVTQPLQDPAKALEAALGDEPDAVITDISMPGLSGLELTRRLRAEYPTLPIIVVTGVPGDESGRAAFEAGASDFAMKPIDARSVVARLDRALAKVPDQELLLKAANERYPETGILGSHPRIVAVRETIRQIAAVPNVPALILGESGTGKNLVARAIHAASPESEHRFVEVNCAALPENLLEAEIFGYEKGAFTDARRSKKGLAEVADGGTLFLDEVGSLAPVLQAKLLTFLESKSFRRLGGTDDIQVNLRIVAATNSDLERDVAAGTFREDLFYRLNVARINLPPLREVREDIGTLAQRFLEQAAESFGRPVPRVDPGCIRRLEAYDWPGNARELRNVVERALIFSRSETLSIMPFISTAPASSSALPPGLATTAETSASLPLGLTLDEAERRYIEATLDSVDGNVGEAAEKLGVTRKVLWSRRKKHGLI